jgi:hypothetical protein
MVYDRMEVDGWNFVRHIWWRMARMFDMIHDCI